MLMSGVSRCRHDYCAHLFTFTSAFRLNHVILREEVVKRGTPVKGQARAVRDGLV